jgi:hypothetical protein
MRIYKKRKEYARIKLALYKLLPTLDWQHSKPKELAIKLLPYLVTDDVALVTQYIRQYKLNLKKENTK